MAPRPEPVALPAHAAAELRRLYEAPERIASGLAAETARRALDLARALAGAASSSLVLAGEREARGDDLGLATAELASCVQPVTRPLRGGEALLVPLRVPLLPSGRGATRVFGVLAVPGASLVRAEALAAHVSALLVADALARVAGTDRLTGLAGRAAFERELASLGRVVADRGRAALLVVDLDDLRTLNATRGYREGDALLAAVAATVEAERPRDALAARIGGDELALLCPGLDREGAGALAARLQKAIAALEVSVSVGIALAPEHGESEELLARADQALAEAKALGRGRAVAWVAELAAKHRRDRLAGVLTGDLARDYRNVAGLLDTVHAVARLAPADETLASVLDRCLELAGAERAILLERPDAGDPWTVRLARVAGGKPATGPLELAASVADAALAEGRAVQRFARGGQVISESAEALGLAAVLCAPLQGEDVAPGALYLDARASVARFDRATLAFLDALAGEVVTVLRTMRLYERLLERTRRLEDEVSGKEAELGRVRRLFAASSEKLAARGYEGIVGASPAMQPIFALLRSLEGSTASVLVEGESGTGKELVARAIHSRSPRRDGPFVSESCAAIAESIFERELFGHARGAFTGADAERPGLLEAAHGGTLFLDEVGELAPSVQAKLLRALQEGEVRRLGDVRARPVDVRIVAATNRDLRAEVAAKAFREDLYYRLAVVRVELPPLRARPTDIPLLVEHVVDDLRRRGVAVAGIAPAALGELAQRPWRGNVRELRNVLERAAILARGAVLEPSHLGPAERPDAAAAEPNFFALPFTEAKARFAALYAKRVLEREGSIAAAARKAGASRQTFYRLLQEGQE